MVAGDLCQQLVRPDPDARRELPLRADQLLHLPAELDDGLPCEHFKGVAHIKVSLIHGNLFHLPAKCGEPRHNFS